MKASRILFVAAISFPIVILITLLAENGLSISNEQYLAVYGHFFLFPLLFFPLIIFLLDKPTKDLGSILSGQFRNPKKNPKWLRLALTILVMVFSLVAVLLDFFKPYYAPWEVKLVEKHKELAKDFDNEGLWAVAVQSQRSTAPTIDWTQDKEWPAIYFYLLEVGSIVNEPSYKQKANWQKLDSIYQEDKNSLSSLLSTKNKAGYTKSLTGFIYYPNIYFMTSLGLLAFILLIFYFIIHLNANDELKEMMNLRRNFLNITLVIICLVIWFVIRFSFLEIQDRFLVNVSKDQEVAPLVLFLIAIFFCSLFWLVKYKDIILGSISLLVTFAGIFLSYARPDFLIDITSSIVTYIALFFIILLCFSLIYIEKRLKTFLNDESPENG